MSAATIDQWTERLVIPQDWKGLRFFGLLDAKYDILIKERVTDEDDIHYYTAWVNLGKGKMKDHYEFESDRKGYYIATDNYEYSKEWISERPLPQYEIIEQAKAIIEEHLNYQKEQCK